MTKPVAAVFSLFKSAFAESLSIYGHIMRQNQPLEIKRGIEKIHV